MNLQDLPPLLIFVVPIGAAAAVFGWLIGSYVSQMIGYQRAQIRDLTEQLNGVYVELGKKQCDIIELQRKAEDSQNFDERILKVIHNQNKLLDKNPYFSPDFPQQPVTGTAPTPNYLAN